MVGVGKTTDINTLINRTLLPKITKNTQIKIVYTPKTCFKRGNDNYIGRLGTNFDRKQRQRTTG